MEQQIDVCMSLKWINFLRRKKKGLESVSERLKGLKDTIRKSFKEDVNKNFKTTNYTLLVKFNLLPFFGFGFSDACFYE